MGGYVRPLLYAVGYVDGIMLAGLLWIPGAAEFWLSSWNALCLGPVSIFIPTLAFAPSSRWLGRTPWWGWLSLFIFFFHPPINTLFFICTSSSPPLFDAVSEPGPNNINDYIVKWMWIHFQIYYATSHGWCLHVLAIVGVHVDCILQPVITAVLFPKNTDREGGKRSTSRIP